MENLIFCGDVPYRGGNGNIKKLVRRFSENESKILNQIKNKTLFTHLTCGIQQNQYPNSWCI